MHNLSTPSKKINRWVEKRFPRTSQLQLHHQHIFIIPSLYSLLLGSVVLILWIMSVQFLINLGYLLVFLILGLIILSMMQTYSNLTKITIQGVDFPPTFAGETTGLVFDLYNPHSKKKQQIDLQLQNQTVTVETLEPDTHHASVLPFVAPHRGWIDIPRITLRTFAPMGFFVAWSYFKPALQLLVFPKPLFTPLPVSNDDSGEKHGQHEIPGREDIIGVREYQLGDSMNLLSWKHLIQRDQWISKMTTQSTGGKTILFDWQQTSDSDTETRLSELCGWLITAHMNGDAFGLKLPTALSPIDSGHAHLHRCLEMLASYS